MARLRVLTLGTGAALALALISSGAQAGQEELARVNQWLQDIQLTGIGGVLQAGTLMTGRRVTEKETATGQKTTKGMRGLLEGFVSTVQDFATRADRVDLGHAGDQWGFRFYKDGKVIGVVAKDEFAFAVRPQYKVLYPSGRGYGVSIEPRSIESGIRPVLATQLMPNSPAVAKAHPFRAGRLRLGRWESVAPTGPSSGRRAGALVGTNSYGPKDYMVHRTQRGSRIAHPPTYARRPHTQ